MKIEFGGAAPVAGKQSGVATYPYVSGMYDPFGAGILARASVRGYRMAGPGRRGMF